MRQTSTHKSNLKIFHLAQLYCEMWDAALSQGILLPYFFDPQASPSSIVPCSSTDGFSI